MSDDSDLIKLYSRQILALAADIPHLGKLAAPQAVSKKRSPLCGSTVTVELAAEEGRISDFAQNVKACALGQAAASILGRNAIGRTRGEIARARDELLALLKEDGPTPAPPFEGLEVLRPAREFKNRHASIMLALEATLEAFDQALA
jgi:NifU-like protein involved in Fe-S cluster formation